jgi:hypothetical protein
MTDSRLPVRDRELFLAEPHIAALSVSDGEDRGPLTMPIWYQYVPGGEAWVLTEAGSRKARLIEAAGRFTLMVERTMPTVRYVSVEGPVSRVLPGTDEMLLEITTRYLPADKVQAYLDFARAELGEQVAIYLRPQRWLTADLGPGSMPPGWLTWQDVRMRHVSSTAPWITACPRLPGVWWYCGMSRFAEVIVLALDAHEVMEPLTRDDPSRSWWGRFVPIHSQWGGSFGNGWACEFERMRPRTGLLAHLESLPWPRPESVQVLIHDEEDDCFGLWMLHDGKLVEVELPRTQRLHDPAPPNIDFPPSPGYLWRTDQGRSLPQQTPQELRDGRPAW